VQNNRLGDDGIAALAEGLPVHLQLLYMDGTSCGDRGMRAMSDVLPSTAIECWSCRTNPAVGDDGWRAMATALPQLCKLEHLHLDSCTVGCSGMALLAPALPTAPRLRAFSAGNCGIGDAGIRVLAAHLPMMAQAKRCFLLFQDTMSSESRLVLDEAVTQHSTRNNNRPGLTVRYDHHMARGQPMHTFIDGADYEEEVLDDDEYDDMDE
jgi:hypothetical protein